MKKRRQWNKVQFRQRIYNYQQRIHFFNYLTITNLQQVTKKDSLSLYIQLYKLEFTLRSQIHKSSLLLDNQQFLFLTTICSSKKTQLDQEQSLIAQIIYNLLIHLQQSQSQVFQQKITFLSIRTHQCFQFPQLNNPISQSISYLSYKRKSDKLNNNSQQEQIMKSISQQSLQSSQNQLVYVHHQNNNTHLKHHSQIVGSVKSAHQASNDEDIMNYETLINKLSKGSISDKAVAIKKLLFLYEHSRARIYLYERRIVESLQLSLLIQEKQVSLSGLTLLQKILSNASAQSEIGLIFKKKLLSKVVLNLGSSVINVRKISHKCVHEFIRKFKDYQSVVTVYLKTALWPQQLQQATTKHLKLKAINSIHSLLMAESKCFRIDQQYALQLIQQLISSSYQKQFVQIKRAALICLICVLKITGAENTLKLVSIKTQNELYQLRMESEELAALLDMIMKQQLWQKSNQGGEENRQKQQQTVQEDSEEYLSSQNAPSPKFISIQQSQVLIQKPPKMIDQLPKVIEHIAKSLEKSAIQSKIMVKPIPMEYSGNQIQQQQQLHQQKSVSEHHHHQQQQQLPRSVERMQMQDKQQSTLIPTLQHHSLSDHQPQPHQLKIFNQVSYAQQFLKKLQKISFQQFTTQSLQQIKSFAPFLEKYLVDESIKLFSISKKIVQVIFDSMQENCIIKQSMTESLVDEKMGQRKEVYVVVVPCVVKGIGNKRFIVRKNLDKLVRTYAKNHPDVWINNFLDRFVKTQNPKIKQVLMDLFSYAYKTSPQFYYPVDKPFQIFDAQISNKNSTLRWKAIDCVVLLIQRQGKQSVIQQMLQKFSIDSYHKILRKLNKNIVTTVISNNNDQQRQLDLNNEMIDIDVPTPVSNYKRKFKRNQRLLTQQNDKLLSIEKSENNTDRNLSQERRIQLNKGLFFKDKQNRKSFIDYDLKQRRKTQKRSRQSNQRTSLQRLPQLKLKTSVNSQSLSKNQLLLQQPQSPVKKSFTEKNIMYTQRSQLQSFDDPKGQLERALMTIKNTTSSWMSHFDSINKIRAVIQNHPFIITQQHLQSIVTDLINCLNGNSRSGVMKISLMCLDELILKLKKRLYPFTQIILQSILKKTISTSQFMADQLKKCIVICAEQLCAGRIVGYIASIIKESKNTEIKLNVLLIIETMVRQQKTYKKQSQWIWTMLIEMHDQPQFQLRQQCKNIVKLIVQLYKSSWKQDVSTLKKTILQKIDKILKNLNQRGQNSWLQQQGIQFQKILSSKGINAKYFALEYTRFEQMDRMLLSKKNWKQRVKHVNDVFSMAFEYSGEFEINLNARKYLWILCQHLDEKNPGQLLNAVNLLIRCIQTFTSSQLMQQVIGPIIQKHLLLLDSKRIQLITTYQKLISRLYQRFQQNKIIKQLIKIVLNSSLLKIKIQALNQLISMVIVVDQPFSSSSLSVNRSDSSKQSISVIMSNNDRQRSRQRFKNNKQNAIIKQQMAVVQLQTPTLGNGNSNLSNLNSLNINVNKLTYSNGGSFTPSAASSSINIPTNLYGHVISNSDNKHQHNGVRSSEKHNSGSINNNKISMTAVNMIMRMVNKITADKTYEGSTVLGNKIKEIVYYCNKRSAVQNSQNEGAIKIAANNNTNLNVITNEREQSLSFAE